MVADAAKEHEDPQHDEHRGHLEIPGVYLLWKGSLNHKTLHYLDLYMKYTVEVFPLHIYCMVCYCEIPVPFVRSVAVYAHHYS